MLMNITNNQLPSRRINFIKAQGYFHLPDAEIAALAFGNRFAYILCGSILAIGVALAHIPTLLVATIIAFATIILPYHPFDYIYNHLLRGILSKPQLPPRSKQLKFACTIATLWLLAIISLFYTGFTVAGYILGGMLVSVALVLVTTDFCIPSAIYNFIFKNHNFKPEINCLK
jgi:hypothetical protein